MMANERKTEAIVRDHFRKYTDQIVLEEQSSDSPKINKLLKTASKQGNGKGYPEFIIQIKTAPDLLIIIECKDSILKHESAKRDNYRDFAVDGALLYSSYISKEFDVISIAVSGNQSDNLLISHHLQLKGDSVATAKFSDKLLPVEDYVSGYMQSEEKFRQDYEKLLLFSKKLNEKLHGHKIVESERALLISCVLIALDHTGFAKSYKDYSSPDDLANYLTNTVVNQFKNAQISAENLAILKGRFSFINTDASLSKKDGVLREIIDNINDNINTFIRTHEYFDVLGQLYIEFLRYANSDKGLGIVLTPPHITEFMAKVGEVNSESVVYDSCAGTGGFLVSAMSVMIKDAKGNQDKIISIKKSQLVGVEYQAHIYALACSNMFIHQDGKTSIINGDCFDPEIVHKVKQRHPTVGLLNPPYKSDKKNDIEELEFVLSNLECLEQGGKCVAILPMQSAIAQDGKIGSLKRKILKQHTLEAVFSMPNELFFNSKVGVVSAVMVFTAKRPHPVGKKTYFGYYKNDGYVIRRTKGRVDIEGVFQNAILGRWITSYINHETIPGFSVTKEVNANDEWCAEAYMETDYSTLCKADFESEVKKYIAYKVQNS